MPTIISALTPETDVNLTLYAVLAGAMAVFWAGWRIANAVRDQTEEIRRLTEAVGAAWTREEHERWAFHLERENTSLPLVVPPVDGHTESS